MSLTGDVIIERSPAHGLGKVARVLFFASALLGLLFATGFAFNLRELAIQDNQYYYGLFVLFFPFVFGLYGPVRGRDRQKVPIYDLGLMALSIFVGLYLFVTGTVSTDEAWSYGAPWGASLIALCMWMLLLESIRRTSGLPLTIICGSFSLYPLVASSMPGALEGATASLFESAAFYAFSNEAAFGIPMRAFGGLVLGFVLFGIGLRHTGAGKFFLDFAFALMGSVRGGAAKVAIFSSGLLGSMSGSVVTNVMTTGVMTIPAMKRTGFRPRYAAAVEACASTGGVLMPPVMGATAFVMASILNIDYVDVAVAAIAPSLLYYIALFAQIDSYAAQNKLKGLPRAELPSLKQTFKEGWHYLFSFALLVGMLIVLRRETQAAFYALAVLLFTNQVFGKKKWGWKELRDFVYDSGKLLGELCALLMGVGLIIGALSVTGLAGTFATDLSLLAGESIAALLLMTAATSFILGMGMTVTAAYIFLAVLLAPALVQTGLSVLAVHMFVLYWGMLSFITPPVAIGAFAASTVAGATPMRVAFTSMRLGAIIYFVPFFFVLNPALIFEGTFWEVVWALSTALVGTWVAASGSQGYLVFFGDMGTSKNSWLGRTLVFVGGLCLAYPARWGEGQVWVLLVSAAFVVGGLALSRVLGGGGGREMEAALAGFGA